MVFSEVDFLSRFEQAFRAGFRGVEYLFFLINGGAAGQAWS